MNRYWISIDSGKTWKEVTLDFWCEMEAACGFHGGRPATSGFTAGSVRGHMHYGWEDDRDPCNIGPHKS